MRQLGRRAKGDEGRGSMDVEVALGGGKPFSYGYTDPFRLACGCSVKVDLEEVVYPALRKVSAELASLGVRFNRRDDVDVIEGVGVRDLSLRRVVYRLGSGQLEAQGIRDLAPSRVVALFSVEQGTGSDVDRFSSKLLEAYSTLARSAGPVFVGKAHSILGAHSTDNEVAVFDLISTRGRSEDSCVLVNNCTVRTIDPTRGPGDYFQVATAIGNSLNDLFCNGVYKSLTILPVFDMPNGDLISMASENIRRYCGEHGFVLQPEHELGLGEVMIGATVLGESDKCPPDFGSEVMPGDLVLVTRPLGELAILSLYLALNILGEEFLGRMDAPAEVVERYRDEAVSLMVRPNLEVARIISRYLPTRREKFDPELHVKESTDISGPGILAIGELARNFGFSVTIEDIPLLNRDLVELAVKLGLVTNGTSGTNGAIALIGSPKLVACIQEELYKAGYEPSVIGKVEGKGEAGLRIDRGLEGRLFPRGPFLHFSMRGP
jgi:selenophosphate synthase